MALPCQTKRLQKKWLHGFIFPVSCGKALPKKEVDNTNYEEIDPFYLSNEWRAIRIKVINKYGKICMKCKSEHRINIDHIKPRKHYPHLELVFDNLQVLCAKCNKSKGNKYVQDFRPDARKPLEKFIR